MKGIRIEPVKVMMKGGQIVGHEIAVTIVCDCGRDLMIEDSRGEEPSGTNPLKEYVILNQRSPETGQRTFHCSACGKQFVITIQGTHFHIDRM